MPRDLNRSPAQEFQSGIDFVRFAILALVLAFGLVFLAAMSGCRAPDAAVLAADAQFYDSIGQEYSANLEAGRIWILRKSILGGPTLTATPMDEDTLERRRAALRSWKELRDRAARGDEDPGQAENPR